ncbi:MAG TPA: energy transducer TonB [Terriglobales bacterium]|nr:energy transducer TonB [Terriglobales bacterium]
MATPARKYPIPEEERQFQVVAAPARVRELFDDSLVESSGRLKTRTGWTVMLSFVLQVLAVGFMILLPLVFIQDLPRQQLMSFLVAPPPPPPPPAPAAAEQIRSVVKVESDILNGRLRTPTRIPEKVKMITESEAPPPLSSTGGVVGGVPGGIPGGTLGGVLGGIIGSTAKVPEGVRVPVATRIRVSQGVSRGLLISKVEPVYPPMAKVARVQGQVVLHAVISREGTIENLHVVSGHPMLIQSALDAVKQWRYKPYLLNNEPVEVETEIVVDFRLTS